MPIPLSSAQPDQYEALVMCESEVYIYGLQKMFGAWASQTVFLSYQS